MTSTRCDVLVAGGGLVGLSLAPALARAGLAVALADRVPIGMAPADPGTIDSRVYAISPGSVAFLEAQRAWSALPADRMQAVEAMRVEGDRGAVLEFSAHDVGVRALAWIVEEREIRAALVPHVRDEGVVVLAPCRFASLAFAPDSASLVLDDEDRVEARLVVGADGVRSWVREAAGIRAVPRPYGQTAVVANFACERPHRGCARQWFREDGGILAWLPLPRNCLSMVWSTPTAYADELLAMDAASLAGKVREAGHDKLGALRLLTPAAAFPLRLIRVESPVVPGVALIGDAAHGVHPMAGQGVNLGFGDVEALVDVLAQHRRTHLGDLRVLQAYARQRAEPVQRMQALTHGLHHLFGDSRAAWLRNTGMQIVDHLPPLKSALVREAMS